MAIINYQLVPEILSTASFDDPLPRRMEAMCDLLEHAYRLLDHPLFKTWNGEAAIDPFWDAMHRGQYDVIHRTYVERTISQGRGVVQEMEEGKCIVLTSKGIEYCIENIGYVWTVSNKIFYPEDGASENSGTFVLQFRIQSAAILMASVQALMSDINNLILTVKRIELNKHLRSITQRDLQLEYLLKVKTYFQHMEDQLDKIVFKGMMQTIEIELAFHKEFHAYNDVSDEIRSIIIQYLEEKKSRISNAKMLGYLMDDDLDSFSDSLATLVANLFSHHDVGGSDPEKVYHALLLGILNQFAAEYRLSSNREAGKGRFDIMLTPDTLEYNGVIIEVKRVDPNLSLDMKQVAEEGLLQIERNNYYQELVNAGHRSVSMICAVFKNKTMLLQHRIKEIPANGVSKGR